MVASIWTKCRDQIGLTTLLQAPRDYKLVVIIRMLRFFSFGGIAIINAKYLKLIGFEEDLIGLFFSFTMLGDLVVSFVLSLIADKIGRRKVMMVSSGILALTALVFLVSETHWAIWVASVFGFMTPSGNEVGPFRSVEQSVILQLVPTHQRSDCYAFYLLFGTLATALGSIVAGLVIQLLQRFYSEKNSDKYLYAMMLVVGLLMCYVSSRLSEMVELDLEEELESELELLGEEHQELLLLLDKSLVNRMTKLRRIVADLFPKVEESRMIVAKLCLLFVIDTAAKSLVTKTWVSYYLKQKFKLQPSELGLIFFFHDCLSAVLTLVGTAISRTKGMIFTMLVTHAPSVLFNTLIPLPSSVPPTAFLVLGRGLFQAMDISSKHAFVLSIVKPEERTAVIAYTNVCRTLGQTLSPSITGYLTGLDMQWVTFVLSGALRVVYDVGLFVSFWKVRHSM